MDLGDDDIIADGGTQIMARDPRLESPSRDEGLASSVLPVPKSPSSLDSLAATIPAKNLESKFVAPSKLAKVPPAPETQPIYELDPDDLEEEEQRRIERTQPFDRSRIFGAPRAPHPRLEIALSPTPPPVSARPSAHVAARVPSVVVNAHVAAHIPSVVVNDAPPPPQNRPASISVGGHPPHPQGIISSTSLRSGSSIAPLAIDIAPARPAPDATLKLPAVRHVPPVTKSNTPLVAGTIAGGLALCAAAIIALVSFSSSRAEESGESTPTVAAKPREAEKGVVRSAVIETPETTPQKAPPEPGTQDDDGLPVYSPGSLPSAPAARDTSSSSHASSPSFAQAAPSARTPPAAAQPPRAATKTATAQPAAAPEPAPSPVAAAPAPAPAPRPAAPPSTTGTIEVPSSLMTVMVDGDYKRVQGGRIVVTCGKHRVNAGRGTQMVDVPCGGVASLM